jgi:hypothetical protein
MSHILSKAKNFGTFFREWGIDGLEGCRRIDLAFSACENEKMC